MPDVVVAVTVVPVHTMDTDEDTLLPGLDGAGSNSNSNGAADCSDTSKSSGRMGSSASSMHLPFSIHAQPHGPDDQTGENTQRRFVCVPEPYTPRFLNMFSFKGPHVLQFFFSSFLLSLLTPSACTADVCVWMLLNHGGIQAANPV